MTPKQLALLKRDELVRKRLAGFVALKCFRNTELENLHAGKSPSTAVGDFSDVKVVSPFGEIPWSKVSRLSDDEMKVLMIEVTHRCYNLLSNLIGANVEELIDYLQQYDPEPDWNDPAEIPQRMRSKNG